MSVHPMPTIPLDRNGLPVHYQRGLSNLQRELVAFLNEWPDRPSWFSLGDVKEGAERLAQRLLQGLRGVVLIDCPTCHRTIQHHREPEPHEEIICAVCYDAREEAQRDAALEHRWEEETGR